MHALLFSTFLILGLVASPAIAEQVVLPRTSVQHIESAANDVGYKLYIGLPRGYEQSKERYPVIYLLDADYSFAIAHNVVEHLADRNHLRWAIVVGISYDAPERYRLNRTRDYTPTHSPVGGYGSEYQKHSGGAPKFRRFLVQELIPFVERNWRTSDERILVGHSYGGLFGAWSLITEPALFNGYVIVSPSLWYDDRMIFDLEAAPTGLTKRAYLAVGSLEGNRERDMVGDLERFVRALRARGGVALRHEVLQDETHNSVFPSALSRGLRYVLKGR